MTKEFFAAMEQVKLSAGQTFWNCAKCNKSVKNLNSAIVVLNNDLKRVSDKLEVTSKQTTKNTENIVETNARLDQIENVMWLLQRR